MKLMYHKVTQLTLFIFISLINFGCSSALKNPYQKYYAIGNRSTLILDGKIFLMYIDEGLIQLELHGDFRFGDNENEIYLQRKDVIQPYYIINEDIEDSVQIRIKFYSQTDYHLFSDPSLLSLDYSFFDQIIGLEEADIVSKNELILKNGFLEIHKEQFKLLLDYEDLSRRKIKEVHIMVSEGNLFIKQKDFKGIIVKNGIDIYWENGIVYKYRKKWRRTIQ